jgi:hypothetical protein
MNNYLPNNPVFESLRESARNYKPLNEFNIYEEGAAGSGIDAKEVQEYYKMIQDLLVTQVCNFSILFPFATTRVTMLNNLKTLLEKQGKSATIKDIVESIKKAWESINATAATDKDFNLVSNVYSKATEGFNKVIISYEALKKLAGSKLEDQALVAYANGLLIENAKQFAETIKSVNLIADAAKK